MRPSPGGQGASITDALARHVLGRAVDGASRDRAARHVLDWLACALAGVRTDIGERLTAYGRSTPPDRAPSSLPALGVGPLPREQAITINGALGNILEMDDIHRTAILHPGPVVVPAALTVAAERGVSGHELLASVVRGYEAMIRVGRALGRDHYAAWHLTGTAGPFGAAAASASLLGLTVPQLRDAFGHAGSVAGGLWQTRLEPSMTKSWHNARAAHHGVLAAELAACGFTAPARILEGELGMFAAMGGAGARPERVLEAPDGAWLIHDTSLKPWPACRHAHATLEAALMLRARLAGPPERLEILTYEEARRFCDKPDPRTALEARFSLQHVAAVALLQGEPGLEAFDDQARNDPAVADLRSRARVRVDERIDRAFPGRYGSTVLAWRPGAREPEVVEVADALGDPPRRLGDDRLFAKARMLMAHAGVSAAAQERLAGACLALTDDAPVAELLGCLAELSPGPGLRPFQPTS